MLEMECRLRMRYCQCGPWFKGECPNKVPVLPPPNRESWLEWRQRDVRYSGGWGIWSRCSEQEAATVAGMAHWQVRRVGVLTDGVPGRDGGQHD